MNEFEIFRRNKITIAVIDLEVPVNKYKMYEKYEKYAAKWIVEMSKQETIILYNICSYWDESICPDILCSESFRRQKIWWSWMPTNIDLDDYERDFSYYSDDDEKIIFMNDLPSLINYTKDIDKTFEVLERISNKYNKCFVILANKTSYKDFLPTSNDAYEIKLIPYIERSKKHAYK